MRANVARQARRLLVRRATLPSCAAFATPARRRAIVRPVTSRSFQRTFIGALFDKPPREVRTPEYEPGWMDIMLWRSRMLDNLRPPPRKLLVAAWKKLMMSKIEHQRPLNSTQAIQCRRLLQYLNELSATEEDKSQTLSATDLTIARDALLISAHEKSPHFLELSQAIYDTWRSGNYAGKPRSLDTQWIYLVQSMCLYGASQQALRLLYETWDSPEYSTYHKDGKVVGLLAEGLAREGLEKELIELVEHAHSHGVPYNGVIQAAITMFFAERDRVADTQQWLARPIKFGKTRAKVYRSIASFARRNDLQDWAISLFDSLAKSRPSKEHWDVILQANVLLGKTREEVDAIMSHMADDNGSLAPDINTINGLLRVAVETKDLALAAQLLSLGTAKRLAPNGETFLVVWNLHLDLGDLAGCLGPYDQVQYFEPWANEATYLAKEYRQLANRYLVALCQQTPPDFKLLGKILESVEEQQLRLEPKTVESLCLRFLENDQQFDVMDILSVYSFSYSEGERRIVQNAFLQFCLDPKTSTSRAWGGYQLLHQFFQDTSFKRRVRLMESFFDRKRPDMASQVFSHMRQHRNRSFHPKKDTYIRCLDGFTRNPDQEGLEMLHNLMKMDTSIRPDTKLLTGLMLAHTACDRPLAALDFWSQITRSSEGPSYASLEGVFWTLERKPSGFIEAREIWKRMEKMDLEVPPAVYNAYVGAIASGGHEAEVQDLISNMASLVGSEPDTMTLGVAYNALVGPKQQSAFQDWAKKQYSQTWTELERKGRRMTEQSLCKFKINRVIEA